MRHTGFDAARRIAGMIAAAQAVTDLVQRSAMLNAIPAYRARGKGRGTGISKAYEIETHPTRFGYVQYARWIDRSKYKKPHQGPRECARRAAKGGLA